MGNIHELSVTDVVKHLAAALISQGALPEKAQADAIHISIAAVHDIEQTYKEQTNTVEGQSPRLIYPVISNFRYLAHELAAKIDTIRYIS